MLTGELFLRNFPLINLPQLEKEGAHGDSIFLLIGLALVNEVCWFQDMFKQFHYSFVKVWPYNPKSLVDGYLGEERNNIKAHHNIGWIQMKFAYCFHKFSWVFLVVNTPSNKRCQNLRQVSCQIICWGVYADNRSQRYPFLVNFW